ncbi:hypothetical protein TNCV_2138751 [Trichonephila clavipes]|nr:hypothetical protein TNCV_2138751 [Trichonephila clavipes]
MPGKRGSQSLLEIFDHRKNKLKLPYCPVMYNTLRRLAATKRTFYHFQQGYEFRNDVYVDGQSFQSTTL